MIDLPKPFHNYALCTKTRRVYSKPRQAEKSFTVGLGKRWHGGKWMKKRTDGRIYLCASNGERKSKYFDQWLEFAQEKETA